MDVSFTVQRKPISERRVRDLVIATLDAERVRDALISVTLVGETTMASLNQRFLSHKGPTDVLSFGLSRQNNSSPVIGDIYICPGVARRNAKRYGIAPGKELERLVVHGTLHILGHDHPRGAGRTESAMWKRQEMILAANS